jgi:hypothetical protein
MSFKSVLKPGESVGVAAGTGAIVFGVYAANNPSLVDTKASKAHNTHVNSSLKVSAFTSAAIIGGVTLITRDVTPLIIAGTIMVLVHFSHAKANASSPATGKVVPMPAASATPGPTAGPGVAPGNQSLAGY